MSHFGLFCPGAIGHLNPTCNLGRELLRRGHQVTLFGVPDVRAKIEKSGLAFYEIGAEEFPLGSVSSLYEKLGQLDGLDGVKFSIEYFVKDAQMLFKQAPEAIRESGVEGLIADQVSTAIGTIAEQLKYPFVTVCNALPINREPGVPPYFTTWDYRDTLLAKLRNRAGNALIDYLTRPYWDVIYRQREQWNLPAYQRREDAYSSLAQISQLCASFDFPRRELPDCWHYTGPLLNPDKTESVSFDNLAFPFEKLTDKPLIYASLGTLQNRNWAIFETIAEACLNLDVQLVVSLGNPEQDVSEIQLPGSPLVVAYAPHQQLIERAALVITHAGMNTAITTLSCGVPMVAIPITNEQPGIATRVARTGAGQLIPLAKLTAPKLRTTIIEVLENNTYRENAAKMQADIQKSGGVRTAADIVERVLVEA
ncbi:MAG: glycosyltransferase [Cyanobacteria bacterium P01_D01_bin.105]